MVTVKGKGYGLAEADEADRLHAVSCPTPPERLPRQRPAKPSWTSVFSRALLELGEADEALVVITAAMGGPTGWKPFAEKFPDRLCEHGVVYAVSLETARVSLLSVRGVTPRTG
ncbi:hypothetical protein [Streptomyces regalis]|uniref:Uncharacterized protein n=1 Tax=Streptomyces regalis TaxID=68262 RepID=A0A101JCN1_9ACTN|nr:hypothetical protein [Streptomyces regalis]KUL24336.1 hypothetical protein ADL12_37635 [Streptomyces regalis]